MTIQQQLQEAFAALDQFPDETKALLHPVLIRMLREPDTLQALTSEQILDHLLFLEQVLRIWAATPVQTRGRLAAREDMFHNFLVGRWVEDGEGAFTFLRQLDDDRRRSVEEVLRVAVEIPATARGRSFNLAVLARLAALALVNGPYAAHVAGGGVVTPFLEEPSPKKRPSKRGAVVPPSQAELMGSLDTIGGAPARPKAKPDPAGRDWHQTRWLPHYAGRLVAITFTMPVHGEVRTQVVFGRCLELSSDYLILDVQPGELSGPVPVLFGLAHIVSMRVIPEEFLEKGPSPWLRRADWPKGRVPGQGF